MPERIVIDEFVLSTPKPIGLPEMRWLAKVAEDKLPRRIEKGVSG